MLSFDQGKTQSIVKTFDLCYSFHALVKAKYGGLEQLHVAAKNSQWNWRYSNVPLLMVQLEDAWLCMCRTKEKVVEQEVEK